MEKWALETPIARPAIADFSIRFVLLDWDNAVVAIGWRDNTGVAQEHRYTESTVARAIITGLNKANLAAKSLHVRAFERLVADGVLGAGAASGTPD